MSEEIRFLVEKARDGDTQAVGRLFELYRLRVVRMCLSYAGIEPADAQDISQEVFLRAFKAIGRLREPGSFDAWLSAITRKRCLSFLASRKRRREKMRRLQEENAVGSAGADGESGMEGIEREMVLEQIERLPDSPVKEAGRRFYLEGQSTSQIAEALDAPVSSVTTWLSRFRGKIRKKLLVRVLALRGHDWGAP